MLTFNELKEMESYYIAETNTYVFDDDITIKFHLNVDADIDAENIDAGNINARNINAGNINSWDIVVGNINAVDITARDINAEDVDAWDILTGSINARDIKYWGVCVAYRSFKCRSVKGNRSKSIHKCLDRKIEFIKD